MPPPLVPAQHPARAGAVLTAQAEGAAVGLGGAAGHGREGEEAAIEEGEVLRLVRAARGAERLRDQGREGMLERARQGAWGGGARYSKSMPRVSERTPWTHTVHVHRRPGCNCAAVR